MPATTGPEDKMTAPGGYVDQALDALGGEDSDFIIKGIPGTANAPYAIGLFCRTCAPGTLTGIYSVGEMELWELAADAREHYEKNHASAPECTGTGKTEETAAARRQG